LLGTVEEIVEILPERDWDEFCRPCAATALTATKLASMVAPISARSLICGTFIGSSLRKA
jgi:hypothetical protein